MMSIARHLTDTDWPGTIYLILGFQSPKDFIFEKEIANLNTRNPRMRVVVTMNDPGESGWRGNTGFIDARLIQATVPDIALHRAHICGPPPMMNAVKATLIGLGVPPDQVKTEAFGTDKRDPTRHADQAGKVVAEIKFLTSRKSAPAREGMTLLDVADQAAVHIDNACRSGACGNCMVKLKRGQVQMAVEDALSKDEKEDGYVLACQAEPTSDVELDA
jgi:ferredoxin-NADP reductase